MHSIQRPRREGRWLPRLGMFATLPHMKGVEVPSDTPLGQAPMGMEGASLESTKGNLASEPGPGRRLRCLLLRCLKAPKSGELPSVLRQ